MSRNIHSNGYSHADNYQAEFPNSSWIGER